MRNLTECPQGRLLASRQVTVIECSVEWEQVPVFELKPPCVEGNVVNLRPVGAGLDPPAAQPLSQLR